MGILRYPQSPSTSHLELLVEEMRLSDDVIGYVILPFLSVDDLYSCYRAGFPHAIELLRERLTDLDQAITLWLRDEQDPVVSPCVTRLLLSQSVGRDLLPHLPNRGAYLSIIRRDLPELFSLILPPPSHHGLILAVLAHFLGKIRVERYLTSHYYRDNVTQWLEELISR
jgi:hypothetical protein